MTPDDTDRISTASRFSAKQIPPSVASIDVSRKKAICSVVTSSVSDALRTANPGMVVQPADDSVNKMNGGCLTVEFSNLKSLKGCDFETIRAYAIRMGGDADVTDTSVNGTCLSVTVDVGVASDLVKDMRIADENDRKTMVRASKGMSGCAIFCILTLVSLLAALWFWTTFEQKVKMMEPWLSSLSSRFVPPLPQQSPPSA